MISQDFANEVVGPFPLKTRQNSKANISKRLATCAVIITRMKTRITMRKVRKVKVKVQVNVKLTLIVLARLAVVRRWIFF